MAGQTDARVEQAAVQQHRQPDEAQATGHATGQHSDQLLLGGGDKNLVQPVRRQLAEEVTEEQEQDAAVEQVATPAQLRLAQQLRAVALPGVLVTVEARQAAHEEHREADVRIDVEDKVVEGVHADAPGAMELAVRPWGRTIWMGCGCPGRAWPWVEQPSKAMGSSQVSSKSGSGGTATGLRLLASEVEQRGQHAGVRGLPAQQRAEDHLQDVRDLAQKGLGLCRRLCRRVLQHHRQVVGQFARRQEQAGSFVGLALVHHGRAAIAAVAMHVLEQMQCCATASVEQLDVVGLHVQRAAARQPFDQGVQFREPSRTERALVVQGRLEFWQVGTQFCVWVAQQVGQHAQRLGHGDRQAVEEAHLRLLP